MTPAEFQAKMDAGESFEARRVTVSEVKVAFGRTTVRVGTFQASNLLEAMKLAGYMVETVGYTFFSQDGNGVYRDPRNNITEELATDDASILPWVAAQAVPELLQVLTVVLPGRAAKQPTADDTDTVYSNGVGTLLATTPA